MQRPIDRRRLVQSSVSVCLGGLLGSRIARAQTPGDPHFLLVLFIGQAWDVTYFWDARHPEMNEKGYKELYLSGPLRMPVQVTGVNGHSQQMTVFGKRLWDKHPISVVNGVHMHPDLIDHSGNGLYAMEGAILPRERADTLAQLVGNRTPDLPVESLLFGTHYSANNFNPPPRFNRSFRMPLKPPFLGDLHLEKLDTAGFSTAFLSSALAARGGKTGFAKGMSEFGENLPRLGKFEKTLLGLTPAQYRFAGKGRRAFIPDITDPILHGISYFKGGLTSSVTIMLNPNIIDAHTHGGDIPNFTEEITNTIDELLTTLKGVEYANGKSMLDVTTVLVASEFTRTTVSDRNPGPFPYQVGRYGTDHNLFGNSAVLAGKGIRPHVVLGATDQQWTAGSSRAPTPVSDAHKKKDAKLVMTMGTPFDFNTFLPQAAGIERFASYERKDYITFSSVANTLFDAFDMPDRRTDGENAPKPVLKPMLSKYNRQADGSWS